MTRAASKPVQNDRITSRRKPALTDDQFHAISRALSDPRRFAILQQVAATDEPLPCGQLQEHAVLSPATVSHHLKELTEAGLLISERDGRCSNLSMQRPVWNAYLKRLAQI